MSDAHHSMDSDNSSDIDENELERRIEERVRYRQVYNGSASSIKLVRPSSSSSNLANNDEFQRLRQQRTILRYNNAKLFDGSNSPQNISTYGFLLGIVCGGGLVFAMLCEPKWEIPQFGLFLAALALFHFLEYLATALFNPDTLTLDSYLINHSAHYHAAHAAAFLEFVIEYYFLPSWKSFSLINYLGLVLVTVGQSCRTIAMFSARHNFSHHIADSKDEDHVLVTHGIYSIMRHPSYFGFFWWAIGIQFLLLNPICLGLFVYWLHRFFDERIAYEEYTLLRFFGDQWTNYKAKTPTWMPLIP
ncbi:Isoprenylcysteine carboxyl methyltransferase family-domain-containing protein [Zychaea mexicana]|uniref:Isoprenylcysteine carboxyl methyltransferase family-domain-containing protein n=1 Tax=Zychaea mexicana TaxID=64656 RepID=UPI0022FEBB74|nr:Isoprenylcysteine carboxyl methyltransferase family-domain-containing protein [Zychaea mexicana]KAI9492462.1 Isoprenylcysteine carboxyl methyltransferase family-domain-containing protein [Zychaea mexicana]